ncbi:MAG: PAS domain S-box protein [Promethearchaeota archaeon]
MTMEVDYRDFAIKLEKDLEESEEKFKVITEQSIIGIGISQRNSLLYVNKGVAKISEYSIQEMQDWNFDNNLSIIYPEDLHNVKNQIKKNQSREKNKIFNYEYRIITKTGKIKWIEQHSKIISYKTEPAYLNIWIDITQKKKIEEAISKTHFSILNAVGNAIRVIDKDFNVTLMNKAFVELTGANKNELLGKKCHQQFSHSKCHTSECTLYCMKKGKDCIEIKVDKKRKDGTKVLCDLVTTAVRTSSGELIGIVEIFKDLTQQKIAERKLKVSKSQIKRVEKDLIENERFLANIFSSIQDGLCVIDKNYTIISANPTMKQWYPQMLPLEGKKCFQVYQHRRDPCIDCLCQQIYETCKPITKFIFRKDQSGDLKTIEVYTFPLLDQLTGKVKGVIEYLRDVTEKLSAEKELKESEEKFRRITEESHLAICILQDNVVKYANQKIADLSEYTIEEILNWKPGEFTKILTEDSLDIVLEQAKKKQAGDSDVVTQYQINCIKKSGKLFWVDNISKTITFQERPADLITLIDITEKKKAEQKLKESDLKCRSILENIKEGFFETDLSGNFTFFNKAFCNILKMPKDELFDKNYSDLFDKETSINIFKKFNEVFKSEIPKGNLELEITSKTGEKIFIQSSVYLRYNSEGKKRGFSGIIRDITEKKKAETMIKKEIEKLKELDEIKTEFISRASHELKTPLVSINSACDLLYQYKENFDEESQLLLNIIKKGGERLENLIKKLIDVSRINSNNFKLKKKKENLVKIIIKCIDDIKQFAQLRNLAVTYDLPKRVFMKIDVFRFRQVIMNILWNALKNTPPFGKISIFLEKKKKFVDIKVMDTGVGFTIKEKMMIFKKFGKIERYGKGMNVDIEGSGLGLYISKEIINAHKGKIWVESKGRNKGSTFNIRLPR